jgi:hypothetical protein
MSARRAGMVARAPGCCRAPCERGTGRMAVVTWIGIAASRRRHERWVVVVTEALYWASATYQNQL